MPLAEWKPASPPPRRTKRRSARRSPGMSPFVTREDDGVGAAQPCAGQVGGGDLADVEPRPPSRSSAALAAGIDACR